MINYASHPYASASAYNSTTSCSYPLKRSSRSNRPKRPSVATHGLDAVSEEDESTFLDVASPSSPSPIAFARASMISSRRGSETDSDNQNENEHEHEHEHEHEPKQEIGKEKKDRRRAFSIFDGTHVSAGLDALLRATEAAPRSAPRPKSPEFVQRNSLQDDAASVTLQIEGLSLDFPRPPFSPNENDDDDDDDDDNDNDDETINARAQSPSTSPSTPGLPLTPSSSDDEFPTIAPLSISKSSPPPRHSSRITSLSSVSRVFAPLDTVAANSLDLSFGFDHPLTSVLEDVEKEAEQIKAVREAAEEAAVKDDDHDPAWVDVDDEEGRDYYRSDIATHLQLFSSLSPFSPDASTSASRHRRGGSSSSLSNQLPPARPDSLPPPPHVFPPAPPHAGPSTSMYASLRRASASSLASTTSKASNRSTRSSKSSSSQRKAKRKTSRARLSAAHGVGKRHATVHTNPSVSTPVQITEGPSSLLDPTFPRRIIPPSLPVPMHPPPPPPPSLNVQRAATRPPPRFSLPVDIGFDEDIFSDEVTVMDEVKEEAEDDDDGDILDPFVDVYVDIGGGGVEEDNNDEEAVLVDPFTLPSRGHALQRTDSSESPLSSPLASGSASLAAPFTLSPYSPTASSPSSRDDAESLFSSYTGGDSASMYVDGAGRPLRSRWSVSTFASSSAASPPSAGSARSSFFPKLQLPSRLSARLRAAREKQQQTQQRDREVRESKPEVIRPFPFFPTPTPPSPKRKNNPGPGRYVPKPELMPPPRPAQPPQPQPQRALSSPATSPRSSTDYASPPSTPSTPSPSAKGKERARYTAQYAEYHAHRCSPEHAAHAPSPTRGRRRSGPSSPDSLSAFPFTLSGRNDSASPSPQRRGRLSTGSAVDASGDADAAGLRRKPIPMEIFMRS
ncbi:hypothetical protein DFH11DRAFT_1725686 [Phellopilus nigrolimitatus]|nr:hypothetical protein DFH11DRAFT_1725686 [Phellopilus nigrolimitatus]